jgi:hypothetical protein
MSATQLRDHIRPGAKCVECRERLELTGGFQLSSLRHTGTLRG